jgi:hypothetical protein
MYPDLILYGYFGTDKNRLSPVKFERSCKKMGNEIDRSQGFFDFGA